MKKINFLILMGIAATQASFTAHADNLDWVNTMNYGISEKRDDAKGDSVWHKKLYDTVKKHMKGHHMGNITREMFEQKAQDIASELREDPEMRDRLTNHVKKMIGERLKKKNIKYSDSMNEQLGPDKFRV